MTAAAGARPAQLRIPARVQREMAELALRAGQGQAEPSAAYTQQERRALVVSLTAPSA